MDEHIHDVDCVKADNTFGPAIRPSCRAFDFTLLFEQIFLSAVPAAVLILASTFRWWQTRRAQAVPASGALLQRCKQLTILSYASTQLAVLILWVVSPHKTDASVAFAVLALLASLSTCPLSYLEGRRSPRPSAVLGTYLFGSSLFDAVIVRTLWRAGPGLQELAVASSVGLGVKIVLLLLEALPIMGNKGAPATTETAGGCGGVVWAREERASVYSLRTFWWINEILWLGRRQRLGLENLYAIDPGLKTARYSARLAEKWDAVDRGKHKYGLLTAVFATLKWPLLAPALSRLVLIGFNFAQPLLIKRAINFVGQRNGPTDDDIGYGLIGATALVYCGLAIFNGYYGHLLYRSITLVRGSLVDIIYQKSLSITLSAAEKAAPAGLVTADVERIDFTVEKLHSVWASIVELSIGIYLLQIEVGWACVAPAVVALVCTLANSCISKLLPSRQKAWNQKVQERVALTSKMLSNMKTVKMMGLSPHIETVLQTARMTELAASAGFRRFMAIVNTIVLVPKQLSAPITLTIFVLAVQTGRLTASRAFTTLSIIEIITTPLGLLLQALPSITSSLACLDRIQTYLQSPDRRGPMWGPGRSAVVEPTPGPRSSTSTEEKSSSMTSDSLVDTGGSDTAMIIAFKDASVYSHSSSTAGGGDDTCVQPVLRSISWTAPQGTLTMVTGPVGSGKTSLLRAILGETDVRGGLVFVRPGPMGYCDQSPWIPNGSVRDCIVGMGGHDAEQFDRSWYEQVLYACALDEDRDLCSPVSGDGTESKAVGSRGMALSEGQKQRLALARAIYSRAPLLILDDIFRSLDLRTEMLISERLLSPTTGLLKRCGLTAVMATHSARHLALADQIVVLKEGTLTQIHDLQQLKSRQDIQEAASAGTIPSLELEAVVAPSAAASAGAGNHPTTAAEAPQTKHASDTPAKKPPSAPGHGARAVGPRDKSTYGFYFRPVGALRMGVLLAAVMALAFSTRFQRIWVEWWTEDFPRLESMYVGVYFVLALGACASFAFFFWWMFMFVVPVTAGGFHEQLLRSILGAPLSYFTTVDSGVILNRFGQDMAMLNGMLPVAFFQAVSVAMMVLGQIATIAYTSKYMAVAVPVTLFALWLLSRFYLLTSQQLRILDIELKAPIYTSLTETREGLATIRAFGWQSSCRRQCESRIDDSKRAIYMLFMVQRWLNLVLDLIVAGLATVLVAMATQLRTSTDPGALGVGLSSVVGFGALTSQFIVAYTELENSLGAIARIKDCVENTESEDARAEGSQDGGARQPPLGWPSSGGIDFSQVTVKYDHLHKPALSNVSFRILPGQKVLLCGRTGSGKSTLISALLRLVDVGGAGGRISVDGVDISTLRAEVVRRGFIVIPQAPFLLPGSVRLNLTAGSLEHDDEAMISALAKVGLWEQHIAPRGGLEAAMSAIALSHGQQQLFCLATAILRRRGRTGGSIVVMDEATSGVDDDTERRMYELIEDEFRACTVINIAHRLRPAARISDLVVVLSGGECVEAGHPKALSEVKGEFWQLLEE